MALVLMPFLLLVECPSITPGIHNLTLLPFHWDYSYSKMQPSIKQISLLPRYLSEDTSRQQMNHIHHESALGDLDNVPWTCWGLWSKQCRDLILESVAQRAAEQVASVYTESHSAVTLTPSFYLHLSFIVRCGLGEGLIEHFKMSSP